MNFREKAKKDIKILLKLNPLVIDANVSVTDITTVKETTRKKRSTKQTIIDFMAVCSLRLTEEFDLDNLKFSFNTTVIAAQADLFDFFAPESIISFSCTLRRINTVEGLFAFKIYFWLSNIMK